MPPTATTTTTLRKPPPSTTSLTHPSDPNAPPRRTASGRAVRQNTTRPTNYYTKPYASLSTHNNNNNAAVAEMADPGFFPALTYFTDAIAALPREVMRQFTLMKEVEAKIHRPNERLGEVVDGVMAFAVPRRGESDAEAPGAEMVSLTAHNSVLGSASASLVNGVAPNAAGAVDNSVAGSVDWEEVVVEEEMGKRQQFHELRALTAKLLLNLDEKNVVLAEANRILAQQHVRIDSVMPHIDHEISEEARLGSMTHWAYADNRQKKQTAGTAANRRDVAATNSLAAAASAIHESDIAQARREATRENAREKHKGRAKEQIDSDFDDKPKKTHAKLAKSKPAGTTGLGISANGEPVKKRRIDKGLAAPAMDRTMSSKGAKATKETPRSTPNAEPGKKMKTKPAPLPAKRKGGLTSASPALASSPLHSSFNVAGAETARPQIARIRQNSTATNLRHEKVANEERPTSAPVKANGERKRKAPATNDGTSSHDEPVPAVSSTHASAAAHSSLKREDLDPSERNEHRPITSRSHSHSGKAGRGSATATPRQESFGDDVPAMKRTRSTRSMRGNNTRDDSSSEPAPATDNGDSRPGTAKHRRNISNSHLVRQLAPFNRSPDLDRHLADDMDEELERLDDAVARAAAGFVMGSGSLGGEGPLLKRAGRSRRNTGLLESGGGSDAGDEGDVGMRGMAYEDHNEGDLVSQLAGEEEEEGGDHTARSSPFAAASPSSPAPPASEDMEADADADGEGADLDPPEEMEEMEDIEAEAEADDADIDVDVDVDVEDYDTSSLGDPDDPDEPKYCYCDRGSYGEMIACDNEQCPREWFHLGCTELREPPDEQEKWFCRDCAPLFSHEKPRGRGGRGRGRRG